jgi:hypothetical protein
MKTVNDLFRVFVIISALLGAPLVIVTAMLGLQRTVATVTCEMVGQYCHQSWGAAGIKEQQY